LTATNHLLEAASFDAQMHDVDDRIADALAREGPASGAVEAIRKERTQLLAATRAIGQVDGSNSQSVSFEAQLRDIDLRIGQAIVNSGVASPAVETLKEEKAQILAAVQAARSVRLPLSFERKLKEIDKRIVQAIYRDGVDSAEVEILRQEKVNVLAVAEQAAQQPDQHMTFESKVKDAGKPLLTHFPTKVLILLPQQPRSKRGPEY